MDRRSIAVDDGCSWALLCDCVRLLGLAGRDDLLEPIVLELPVSWLSQLQHSLYRSVQRVPNDVAVFAERCPADLDVEASFVLCDPATRPSVTGSPTRICDITEFGLRVLSEEGERRLGGSISDFRLNSERMVALRNIHLGDRAFIVGNGPSLRRTNMEALSNEITFGFNAIFLIEEWCQFRPTYYLVEDRLIAEDREAEINDYTVARKFFPCDQSDRLDGGVYLPWATHYGGYPRFSDDVSSVIYSGWTVTYVAIQLAWYMGIRDIVLIGVDGTYRPGPALESGGVMTSVGVDTNHFHPDYYGPGRRFHPPSNDRVIAAHMLAALHVTTGGGSIRNATPDTQLNVYEKVSLDTIMGGGRV